MRKTYRVLGFTIVALVGLQAAAHAWASSGMGLFVMNGGVIDASLMSEEGAAPPFPEVMGFMIHGINGLMVIPVVALALLVVSFFTKVRGAIAFAGLTLGLVALQVTLGMMGHGMSSMAFLHGVNAIALAGVALYAQSLAGPAHIDRRAGAEHLAPVQL